MRAKGGNKMIDKEKTAYYGGYNDYKKCNGRAMPNPIEELVHPSYKPDSNHPEAYKAGWDRAKQEKK